MPPVFLPLPAAQAPASADYTKQLALLGDTISGSIRNYQRARLLQGALQPGPDGNIDYEKAAVGLIGAGESQAGSAIASIGAQKENRAFRMSEAERSQRNTDRSFGLQEKQIGATISNAQATRDLAREQFNFQKDYKEKELGLKRLELDFKQKGGYKDLKERADVEGGLRKEFTKLSDDYIKVRDSFGRIQASAKNPSAAGDLALIFNYMKMLDPGSTVREGEFATAQNAAGIPDRLRAQWNKALTGERLAPNVREDFVSRSKSLFETQSKQHGRLTEQFKSIGNRLGVDVQNVTPDFGPDGPSSGAGVVDWQTYFGGQ